MSITSKRDIYLSVYCFKVLTKNIFEARENSLPKCNDSINKMIGYGFTYYFSAHNTGMLPSFFFSLLRFYFKATSKVIEGRLQTCDWWWLCSAALWGDPAIGIMTAIAHSITLSWYWKTRSFPILTMSRARLCSDKYQFWKSLVWLGLVWTLHLPDGRPI